MSDDNDRPMLKITLSEHIEWLNMLLEDHQEMAVDTVLFESDETLYSIHAEDDTVIIEEQDNE